MINKNVSPLVIGLFDTNLSQSPYVIDSHQVNWIPILHPIVIKISMHLIKSPNRPNLSWSCFFWPTITFLTILASSKFLSSHSLTASCNFDINQNSKYFEQKNIYLTHFIPLVD